MRKCNFNLAGPTYSPRVKEGYFHMFTPDKMVIVEDMEMNLYVLSMDRLQFTDPPESPITSNDLQCIVDAINTLKDYIPSQLFINKGDV